MVDIGTWLRGLKLERYEQAFLDNDIDAAVLPDVTADDLIGLGVTSIGHRRKILAAISRLQVGEAISPSTRTPDPDPEPPSDELSRRPDAERRQLTVMLADLAGSTELATRLDPEDMGALIRTYQGHCARVIESWAGHVAKYMGDGVLAYFGWPRAHEDDPERAVRAGLALAEAIGALRAPTGDELAARVGIATGLVMVGDLIGEGAAQEAAVVGDTPNLAARLQGLARAGAVVVAPGTRRLLRGVFDLQDLGEHDLKGFEAPVRAWQVAGEAASESRFEARTRHMAPLVGRDDEVEILTRRWQRAQSGEGQVVLITGEPGIGKSRLVATLRELIAHEPHTRLTYQCSPHHTESAFHPVIRQLEYAAGIRPEQGPTEKLDRLEALLSPPSDASETQVPLLASLLSIPVEPTTNLGAEELKERTLRALVGQLEGLATVRPVLVVFEDLHWADPSTLELLDRLVERIESLPVLVLLTARPGFAAAWTDQAHVAALNLNRIGRRDSRVLLESLAGELPDDLIEAITARGDGVPLFIEEISRTVLESRRGGDGDGMTFHAEVPASLQDSLMARLDRLPTAKPVAQTAAALGRDFSRQMLEPISDLPRPELDKALDELVVAGVLSLRRGTSEPSYVFKHAMVQDAAYNSLLRGSRRQLHRRIAETLGERLADEPVLLAHHWEGAQDLDQALKYRLVAGENAAARSAMREASAQYWRALELLRQLPESKDTRRHHLATLLAQVRLPVDGEFWPSDADRGRALQYIDKAIEIATDDSDPAALARLKAYKADRWVQEPLLIEALSHASDAGDQRVKADVHRYFGGYHGMLGRFEESIRHIERAIEMYAGLGANIDQGLLMAGAGRCYSARAGRLERSLHYAGSARAIAEATGNLALKSWLAMEAEPCLYKGLWQRTVDIVDQELPAAWEIGNWATVLWCSGWATIGEVKLGRTDAALVRIETALRKAGPRSQNPFAKSYPLIALGHVRLAEGELAAALDAAREASEMAERAAARMEKGAAHRLLGQIHEARGDRAAAEAEHKQSLDILGAIQSRPELAQSLLAYGRFKRADNPDEGGRLLGEALAMFEDMDATGWIAETRAALE